MTRRSHHPLPKQTLKLVARLVQVHFDTHPERLARRFGLSPSYVRQLWRSYLHNEMAPLDDALVSLKSDIEKSA